MNCVIMSIYNGDTLNNVKEALNSLYNQTLIVDIFIKIDGEINNNLYRYIYEEYKNNKIKYLSKRNENKGLAYSLNELLEIVLQDNYKYIFRMDADDISNKNRFKKQIDFMELNQEIDICGTFIKEFSPEMNYEKVVKYPLTHEKMFKFFEKRPPLAHVSVCFKNTFFKKAGLYPEDNHITNEDTLMWMKGFKYNCKFANIDYIGVNVRVNICFFNRRKNLKKIWYDFKNRLIVIKTLNYGIHSYIYAIGILIINLLPPKLKKIAYKYLR